MITECGIFACFTKHTIKHNILYNSLANIQHRGQDSYGYVTFNKDVIIKEHHLGMLPADIAITQLDVFIGHMRYSTLVDNADENKEHIQPLEISNENKMYIAFNGNLPNLTKNLNKLGINEVLSCDTYLFKILWDLKFKYKKCNKCDIIEYIKYIIENVSGAYSCALTYFDEHTNSSIIFAFRDRWGYKPLSVGSIEKNYCIFSESVQLDDINNFICDIGCGQIYELHNECEPKLIYTYMHKGNDGKIFMCSLEPIYFMKKDSLLFNGSVSVNEFRKNIGFRLAKQEYLNISNMYVTYIPESSYSIAAGYALSLKAVLRDDLIVKIENVRSFIENSTDSRTGKIKRKFAFNDDDIRLVSEIILIDDSIVRGNTMIYIIKKLKQFNPKIKIHIRIGCPYIIDQCNFGIDIASKDELIYNKFNTTDELCNFLGADSIIFLDGAMLGSLFAKYGVNNCRYCFGSTNGANMKTLDW